MIRSPKRQWRTGRRKGISKVGHWSLVIGHWSLVIGHWSLVVRRWLSDFYFLYPVPTADFGTADPWTRDDILDAVELAYRRVSRNRRGRQVWWSFQRGFAPGRRFRLFRQDPNGCASLRVCECTFYDFREVRGIERNEHKGFKQESAMPVPWPPTTDHRPPTTDHRPPTTGCRLPTLRPSIPCLLSPVPCPLSPV
jgi:hypothetical protein